MNHPWLGLAIFAIKAVIVIIAIALVLILFFSLLARGKTKGKNKITIKKVNDRYKELGKMLQQEVLSKRELKQQKRADKKKRPGKKARKKQSRRRIYLLKFKGDPHASYIEQLRQEVTLLLTTATPHDEVVVLLESPGGLVSRYGLAASQLQRIRDRNIPLTVSVDCIAASGGYMMACIGDKVLAAPFAIIGSIGVIVQLPNFHRFLQKHNIDFEQITAGKYKRTLTLFGRNSDEHREKMQQDIEIIQQDFIDLVKSYRPQIDIDKVATGEYWLALQAKKLELVDELITSDDYLLKASEHADIFAISSYKKKRPIERLMAAAKGQWRQLSNTDPIY